MCVSSHEAKFYVVPRILLIKAAPRCWDEPEALNMLIDQSLLAAH